jgi:hypothetical protein
MCLGHADVQGISRKYNKRTGETVGTKTPVRGVVTRCIIRKYNGRNAETPTRRYGDSTLMGSRHNF